MQITGGFTFTGGMNLIASPSTLSDPYFQNVVMLLQGEGDNGKQNNTFLDSSTNNFTVSRFGDLVQGTFSPFSKGSGRWGVTFDGSGDYMTYGSNVAFTLGTGDFTVEAWIFMTGTSDFSVFNIGAAAAGSYSLYYLASSQKFESIRYGDPGGSGVTSNTYGRNQWYHIAAVRSGGTSKLYINGVEDTGATYAMGSITASAAETGRIWQITASNSGFISNLRVVKGTAVYTSNFTPPTQPLTAIANTQLLTSQNNRFVDGSTNAFVITKFGETAISSFSPFVDSTAYSPSAQGGGFYFDGSGDYLSVPSNSAFQFGSSDWTIEFWINPSSFANFNVAISYGYDQASTSRSFIVYVNQTTGLLRLAQSSTGSNNSDNSTGITLDVNTWQHIAIVRNGANITSYYNGVSSGTSISALSLFATSSALTIGTQNDLQNYFTGYMSDVRIVKGTAVYTSNFTPPSAPLTAITNTSLLISATNGGIIDTSKNSILRTIGNTQASTTQQKFGLSSVYFDGSGDYLLCDPRAANLFAFGTGNFTIELWVYLNTVSGFQVIYDSRPANTQGVYPLIYTNGTGLNYDVNTVNRITASSVLTSGTWYHLALCRSGTDTKMFLNGNQIGSTYTGDNNSYLNPAGNPRIGIDFNLTSNSLNGYIDELRITLGIARYTSNFIVPNAAFPGV